jgi:hypothetical protein
MSADDQPTDPAPELDSLAFRLLSIERHAPPAGGDGKDWFSYKISQGQNMITGYRRGSLATVTDDVRKVVEGLNERRGVRRGRVDLKTRSPARPAPRDESVS